MTNAEARFNKSLRPRKPEGSLGRTAQDVHLDSHTAPELYAGADDIWDLKRAPSGLELSPLHQQGWRWCWRHLGPYESSKGLRIVSPIPARVVLGLFFSATLKLIKQSRPFGQKGCEPTSHEQQDQRDHGWPLGRLR